jgi:hypothetical protein
MIPFSTGLSTTESVCLFVVLCATVFAYCHFPRVPAGRRGILLEGVDIDPFSQRTCESGCVVCPRCETENSSVHIYCSNCVSRL